MKNPRARNEMYARHGMKYARQKNEMPVAGNATFFIQLAWTSHIINTLGRKQMTVQANACGLS
jgi:hypothetical protein